MYGLLQQSGAKLMERKEIIMPRLWAIAGAAINGVHAKGVEVFMLPAIKMKGPFMIVTAMYP